MPAAENFQPGPILAIAFGGSDGIAGSRSDEENPKTCRMDQVGCFVLLFSDARSHGSTAIVIY
jgi:hypothetical protein